MAKDAECKAFKDYFDAAAARSLAAQVARVHPSFDARAFEARATRGLKALAFAARVRQFSDALRATLPDPPRGIELLRDSLPPALPDTDSVTDGWLQWPIGQYIADHGLAHFDLSMDAMRELTMRFSSEFAVRPFVEHRPKETLSRLRSLTEDDNPHVRRWCSEGTRPRLPWGKKLRALVEDPSPIFPILEALRDDPDLYVRRSVANNLGDIAKDHPDLVLARCRAWQKNASAERRWLIAHALRVPIKNGDPEALAIIGYGPPKRLRAELTAAPAKVRMGDVVTLSARIETTSSLEQNLLVDYLVHFRHKRGGSAPKVFKWTKTTLPARGTLELDKRHRMKTTTIRTLYAGEHRVDLQVNGERVASTRFRLV